MERLGHPIWKRAYSETLKPAELKALCVALNERDEVAFRRLATPAGRVMEEKSTRLLSIAGGEVLAYLGGAS